MRRDGQATVPVTIRQTSQSGRSRVGSENKGLSDAKLNSCWSVLGCQECLRTPNRRPLYVLYVMETGTWEPEGHTL